MDYGAVLSRAWQIGWRNKALWVLGVLAGCSASGRGGGGGPSGSGMQYQFDSSNLPPGMNGDFRGFERFLDNNAEVLILIGIGLFCLALFIGLFFLALGVIGQGGLIAGYASADEGAKITLGEAFSSGLQYFWRLLGIRVVFWLAGLVIGIVLFLGALGIGIVTFGIGLLCLIPLVCLLIPIALAVDAYVALTMVAAIEDDKGVLDAFGRSWEVVRENLGPVVVMGLILVVGGGIVTAILFLPFIGVALPAITGALVGSEEAVFGGIAISVLCLVAAIPVAIALNGVVTTFITGSWTLTYRRLTGKEGAELAA